VLGFKKIIGLRTFKPRIFSNPKEPELVGQLNLKN
jgi:hypothetical protein